MFETVAGFGTDIYRTLMGAIREDAAIQAELERIAQVPRIMLGLVAMIQHRRGLGRIDPTGGKLAPYLGGVTSREPRKEYKLAFLARVTAKIDGVEEAFPLTVYDDDVLTRGTADHVKFIVADADFNAADDDRARTLMAPATQAFGHLLGLANKVLGAHPEVTRNQSGNLDAFAREILVEAHKRMQKYNQAAFQLLRHVKLTAMADVNAQGRYQTMAIGVSREKSAVDVGILDGIFQGLSDQQPSAVDNISSARKGLIRKKGGPAPAQPSFSGKSTHIDLFYAPAFVVESVYESISDQVLNVLIAEKAEALGLVSPGYAAEIADVESIVDPIAAMLIHEAYHNLHGHNTPTAGAFDRADKALGPVFENLVNVVGDALINQEILETTGIRFMPYGGIIKSWDLKLSLSPSKLAHEVATKRGSFDHHEDPAVCARLIEVAKDCARSGVESIPAVVTFSWPSVRGQDLRFFGMTKWFIRAVASELPREKQPAGAHSGLRASSPPIEDEQVLYDVLSVASSAQVLGDEILKAIAQDLAATIRKNVTIDWVASESARAKLRVLVKRLLTKYGYPPDLQAFATQRVLEHAEFIAKDWPIYL